MLEWEVGMGDLLENFFCNTGRQKHYIDTKQLVLSKFSWYS